LLLPDRPAIAVLLFTNKNGDPEQEYFSDGIRENIIPALSKLRWFFVIARNSSFIYKGKAVHMKQVAEELGVGYVVEGSARKSGDRVRITAQLNDVSTGSHIWAKRYDRDLADVFAIQDESPNLSSQQLSHSCTLLKIFRARRKPPGSLDAWDLVMRALSHYWRMTRQHNVVAQALLEKAIAIDPNHGQALGVLAASHTSAPIWAGRICQRWRRSPSARRYRRFEPTAKTPGPIMGSLTSIYSRGASTTRWPSSSWRCG
jgi:TolB-like protein